MLRIVGVMVTALFAALAGAQSTDATIRAKCSAEWPGDASMQSYCESNQRQAVMELQQLNSRNGGMPAEAFRVAQGRCVTDWPDDFSMQAYCLRQQIEGYSVVARGPSSPLVAITPEESRLIAQRCSLDWPFDYSMQAYCQRQQVEGLAFIRNRPPSVPSATWNRLVGSCELEWRNDFSMQAYCVRSAFN